MKLCTTYQLFDQEFSKFLIGLRMSKVAQESLEVVIADSATCPSHNCDP